ncbi:hypothetical protein CHS0354_011185 [Potamilus streckersoni]|uniref:Uncharacterized protein n=1 Tax=Potamilus streckersoni TaxID=2493646 RepID=A0AAE0S155_9BIVA|nr:hypothetical protein CHS0354_011185 [Potamilus streckersoni]
MAEEIMIPPPEYCEQDFNLMLRPVSEHVLTPCASQLEIQKLEAEAILGSPLFEAEFTSARFVEALLLRLLNDLDNKRLSNDEIMKLASYSLDIIQTAESRKGKDLDVVTERDESSKENLISTSSSFIANEMVKFTLEKILEEFKSGIVEQEDVVALTISALEMRKKTGVSRECALTPLSETELKQFIEETSRSMSAVDEEDISPVCSDVVLDNFILEMLKNLIKDLEEETLTKEQMQTLAKSIKEETMDIVSDKDVQDLHSVLQTVLQRLQNGELETQILFQIVISVVYSYNILKYSTQSLHEGRVTDQSGEVISVTDQIISKEHVPAAETCAIKQVGMIVPSTNLNLDKIQKSSGTIITSDRKSTVLSAKSLTDLPRCTEKDFLLKATSDLQRKKINEGLIPHVEETAVTMVTENDIDRGALQNVLLDILKYLKMFAYKHDVTIQNDIDGEDIESIIRIIQAGELSPAQLKSFASTVANLAISPLKSDSSFVADISVKDVLCKVRDEMAVGNLQNSKLNEITDILMMTYRSLQKHEDSTTLSVLHHVSYRVQCGDFTEKDMEELGSAMADSIKDKKTQTGKGNESVLLLNYIDKIMQDLESGALSEDEAKVIGVSLFECSQKLLLQGTGLRRSTAVVSLSSDKVADGVAPDLIQTLEEEIECGKIDTPSLLQITKSVMKVRDWQSSSQADGLSSKSSDSKAASEAVAHVLRSINRDLLTGKRPESLSSNPPTLSSPSGSNISSIVRLLINDITKELDAKSLPLEMLSSVAADVMSMISESSTRPIESIFNFAGEHEFEKTIKKITKCLKRDKMQFNDAQRIFSIILQNYQYFILREYSKESLVSKPISEPDSELISDLIRATIRNIELSIKKGRFDDKDFSIPSTIVLDDKVSKSKPELIPDDTQEIHRDLELSIEKGRVEKKDFPSPSLTISKERKPEIDSKLISSLMELTLRDIEINIRETLRNVASKIERKQLESKEHSVRSKTSEATISETESEAISEFIREVLRNVVYSIENGQLDYGDVSLSSMKTLEDSSEPDSELISALIKTTLKNIESSIKKGHIVRKDFSIPSMVTTSEITETDSKLITGSMNTSLRNNELLIVETGKLDIKDMHIPPQPISDQRSQENDGEEIAIVTKASSGSTELRTEKEQTDEKDISVPKQEIADHNSEVDSERIKTLITATLKNIEASIEKGRLENNDFSIPSMRTLDEVNSDINSELISVLITSTLKNIQASIDKGMLDKKDFSIPSMTISYDERVDIDSEVITALIKSSIRHIESRIEKGQFEIKKVFISPQTTSDDSRLENDTKVITALIKQSLRDIELRTQNGQIDMDEYCVPSPKVSHAQDLETDRGLIAALIKTSLRNIESKVEKGQIDLKEFSIPSHLMSEDVNSVTNSEQILNVIKATIRNIESSEDNAQLGRQDFSLPSQATSDKRSDTDSELVTALIRATLRNIESSIQKGQVDSKDFSIPSMETSFDRMSESDSDLIAALVKASLRNIESCTEKGRSELKDFSIPHQAISLETVQDLSRELIAAIIKVSLRNIESTTQKRQMEIKDFSSSRQEAGVNLEQDPDRELIATLIKTSLRNIQSTTQKEQLEIKDFSSPREAVSFDREQDPDRELIATLIKTSLRNIESSTEKGQLEVKELHNLCEVSPDTEQQPDRELIATHAKSTLRNIESRIETGQSDITGLSIQEKLEDRRSETDSELLSALIKTTLRNIESSVEKGNLDMRDFSIPSLATSSDRRSQIDSDVIVALIKSSIKNVQSRIENRQFEIMGICSPNQVITDDKVQEADRELVTTLVKSSLKNIESRIEKGQLDFKSFSTKSQEKSEKISETDSEIIKALFKATLKNIESSHEKGRLVGKDVSISSQAISNEEKSETNVERIADTMKAILKRTQSSTEKGPFENKDASFPHVSIPGDRRQDIDSEIMAAVVKASLRNIESSVNKGMLGMEAISTPSPSKSDNLVLESDQELIATLIKASLKNIESRVEKEEITSKYCIPLQEKSDDKSSKFVSNLVKAAMNTIRNSLYDGQVLKLDFTIPTNEKPVEDLPNTSKQVVQFTTDVMREFITGVRNGKISNLSARQFLTMLGEDEFSFNDTETAAVERLEILLSDIQKNQASSVYFRTIVDTFLFLGEYSNHNFGDPFSALEEILVNVSFEILTKFVRATLQNVLTDVRQGHIYSLSREPSSYLLQSVSSIIADIVVKEVLRRVNREISPSKETSEGHMSRQEFERAASQARARSAKAMQMEETEKSEKSTAYFSLQSHSVSSFQRNQCMSPVRSKEVEDLVLETLHNIISNFRFEGSVFSRDKDGDDKSVPEISCEVQDYVLQTLQTIIEDLQDKRLMHEVGILPKPEVKGRSDTSVHDSPSVETAAYISEVLQIVIAEFHEELSKQENVSQDQSQRLETYILDSIKDALTEKPLMYSSRPSLKTHKKEIKGIVMEALKTTILLVENKSIGEEDIASLVDVLTSYQLKVPPEEMETSLDVVQNTEKVLEMLNNAISKIEENGIDEHNLEKISAQLAVLGLRRESESSDTALIPKNFTSEVSVSSSAISSLIQNVLLKLSEQLSDAETKHDVHESSLNSYMVNAKSDVVQDHDNYTAKSDVSTLVDKNTNRQMSMSTVNTGELSETSTRKDISSPDTTASYLDISSRKNKENFELLSQIKDEKNCTNDKQASKVQCPNQDQGNQKGVKSTRTRNKGSLQIKPNSPKTKSSKKDIVSNSSVHTRTRSRSKSSPPPKYRKPVGTKPNIPVNCDISTSPMRVTSFTSTGLWSASVTPSEDPRPISSTSIGFRSVSLTPLEDSRPRQTLSRGKFVKETRTHKTYNIPPSSKTSAERHSAQNKTNSKVTVFKNTNTVFKNNTRADTRMSHSPSSPTKMNGKGKLSPQRTKSTYYPKPLIEPHNRSKTASTENKDSKTKVKESNQGRVSRLRVHERNRGSTGESVYILPEPCGNKKRDDPLEVKSLCGIHKTRVSYRNRDLYCGERNNIARNIHSSEQVILKFSLLM